jgi:hypothetical protein
VSYVFSGLGGLGASVEEIANRISQINDEIGYLKEEARATSANHPEGPDSLAAEAAAAPLWQQVSYLESQRADLIRAQEAERQRALGEERDRLAAIDAEHAARAKEREAFHAKQSAEIAASSQEQEGYWGLAQVVSSIKNAFTGAPSSSAPATTTTTTTYASKSASDSSGVISALQSQRNVALQQAAALPPGPAQQQQLQVAAGAEQQIKANGGTPDSTYVAAARAAQSPTYQPAASTAPQAVSMPSAPKGPSAIMQMALASQQRQQAIPAPSLFDSLGPVQLYNKTSTAAKIGVGVVAVGGLSLVLYLALRPKK